MNMDKENKANAENENPREPGSGGLQEPDNALKSQRNRDIDETDKYLAMEQPGVTFTEDTNPANLSDTLDYDNDVSRDGVWSGDTEKGSYSDAFSQDDYILRDNVDLDEDQAQSLSSDDEDFEEANERY